MPATAMRWPAALGGERLALAGVGHMPMLEVPFSFRRALDGWL